MKYYSNKKIALFYLLTNIILTVYGQNSIGGTTINVNIDAQGAANASIPVYCPPGRQGMQPNVSINYNSSGSDGVLGKNMAFTGTSVITRVGNNYHINGKQQGITLDNTKDNFLLDGVPLIWVGGASPGTKGSIYRTEMDQFSKITFYDDYFSVELKDGGIMFYGIANNSSLIPAGISGYNQAMAFYLYRKYDINGNYIEYDYQAPNGQVLLDEIRYTGYDATLNGTKSPTSTIPASAPFNKIKFKYKAAVSTNKAWVKGYSLWSGKIIEYIEVFESTNKVREYTFNYVNNSLVDRLTSVQEKNGASESYEAISFLWDEGSGVESKQNSLETANYDNPTYSGDFNGDGRSDILIINGLLRLEDGYYLTPNHDYSIYTTNPISKGINQKSINNGKLFRNSASVFTRTHFYTNILIGDVNQDGLDDIIIQELSDHGLTASAMYFKTEYNAMLARIDNTGKLVFDLKPWYFKSNEQGPYYPQYQFLEDESEHLDRLVVTPYLVDCDGDGKLDLAEVALKQTSNGENWFEYLHIVYARNNERYEMGGYTYFGKGAKVHQVVPMDFNGNGKTEFALVFDNFTDILEVSSSNTNTFGTAYHGFPTQSNKGIQTGDFNGDGKTDLISFIPGDGWYIDYSTGIGFDSHDADVEYGLETFSGAHYSFCEGTCGSSFATLQVGDFNGDGKSDILSRHYHTIAYDGDLASNSATMYYSTGYDFQSVPLGANSAYSPAGLSSTYFNYHYSLVTDFDGDGASDMFSRQYTTLAGVGRIGTSIDYFRDKTLSLSKIVPNSVSEHVFKFKPLPQSTQFQRGTKVGFDQMVSIAPRILITEEYNYNVIGTGVAQTYNYYYKDYKFHRHGRGGMGFLETAVIEQRSSDAKSIVMVTTSEKDPEKTYKLNTKYVKTFLGYTIANNFAYGTTLLTEQEQFYSNKQTIINPTQVQLDKSPNIKNIHFSYINAAIETDYLSRVRKKTCFEYDENGNMYISKVTYYDVDNYNKIEHVNTTFNLFESQGSWLPSVLKKTKNTLIRYNGATMASPHTVQLDFTNSIKNQVLKSESFVDDPSLWVSNIFSYDGYGNVTSKKRDYIANTSGTPITEKTITYVSNGRFVSTIKNVMTQTDSFIYEPKYGNILSETSASGLTTTYSYDNWGRITNSILPNGNMKSVERVWSSTPLPTFVTGNTPRYYVKAYNNLGEQSWEYYDNANRKIATKSSALGGAFSYTDVQFDSYNRVIKESNRYDGSTNKIYSETIYGNNHSTPSNYNKPIERKYNGVSLAKYAYDKTSITVTTKIEGRDIVKTSTQFATGHPSKVVDPGGEVLYTLGSHNLPLNIQTNGTTTTFTYNNALKQTQLCDPNAGCSNYEYNALGQLTKQTDAKGNEYTMEYDLAGRLVKKGGDEGDYEYSFYNTVGQGGLNKLHTEELKVGGSTVIHSKTYTYGSLGELLNIEEEGAEFSERNTSFTYDEYSRLQTTVYPNITTENVYDATNNHVGIKLIDRMGEEQEIMLWEKVSALPDGQTTQFNFGNGIENTIGFDSHRQLQSISDNSEAVNIEFNFELESGNLISRNDHSSSMGIEGFSYDNNDRLINFAIESRLENVVEYSDNGNIVEKYGAGSLSYGTLPHAVTNNTYSSDLVPSFTPTHYCEPQEITYTPFNKVSSITQTNESGLELNPTYEITFNYGVDQQRMKMLIVRDGEEINTTYYIKSASMELVNDDEVTYIYAGGKPVAMHRLSDNAIYYLHTDYQNSLIAISDEAGVIVERRSYDAWGRPRNIEDYKYNLPNPFGGVSSTFTLRGYTFHEHLEMVGLINMNGRMYDPVLGRILSPDNYVQEPGNTQSFNRYSYCLNNPTKYTDPSGDIFFTAAVLIAAPFTMGASLTLLPYAVGADIGMWQGGSMANGTMNPFKWDYSSGKTWGYMAAGAVIGGASGAAGAGAGSALTSYTSIGVNHVLYGATTGAVSGAIGGFGMGGLSGVAKNGKWNWGSAWSGMGWGAAGGFVLGGASTAVGNWIMGRNIWNGNGKYSVDPSLLSEYKVNLRQTNEEIGSRVSGDMPRWEVNDMIDYVNWEKINPVEMNGSIRGNADEIYGALTRGGGELTTKGALKLDNGAIIKQAISSGNEPTIYVNYQGMMYKLRISK